MRHLSTVLFIFLSISIHAQTTEIWQVNTKDGNQFIGHIVSETADTVSLKTTNLGVLKISRIDISSMEIIPENQTTSDKTNPYWPRNHHSTRHFFGPNAYTLKKGEGYYQNTLVLLNHVSYGFTDRFTIGAGIIPVFLLGSDAFPMWITPKVRLTSDDSKINVALGALAGGVIESNNSTVFGLPYLISSFGTKDRNLSLGVGWGMGQSGDFSDSPAITASGMYRVSKSTYLLTENYIFPGGGFGLVSLGARTSWTHIALDYGLVIPLSDGVGFDIAIPWLGISIPFR